MLYNHSKMTTTTLIAYFIISAIYYINAARILAVFPAPIISHQFFVRPVFQELAKRGHEVVVITADPEYPKGKSPANLTEIDIHDLAYKTWKDASKTVKGIETDYKKYIKFVIYTIRDLVDKMLETDVITNILYDKKGFNLILLQAFMRPLLILQNAFKVPVIQLASFNTVVGNDENLGIPIHPIIHPNLLRRRIYNLTMFEILNNFYDHLDLNNVNDAALKEEDAIGIRHFGTDFPSLRVLTAKIDMLFLNTNPLFDGNRPMPPSVYCMGGQQLKPIKGKIELGQDLQDFMDSSERGVIYMSFGTNVKTSLLAPETIKNIVKVFSQLPYDILWKWDEDVLPGQTKNIKIGKWFPQSHLLKHPKIKLFITQGGIQSTSEAIAAGVPLIGIPMLADQWYNAEKYIYHKIGLKLDLETFTEKEFKDAIETMVEDENYRRNIARLRMLIYDQPHKPLDRAVWWIERVLRHGGAEHLRAPAANMPWREYLELDIVIPILIGVLVAIALILYFLYTLLRRIISITTALSKFKTKNN